MTNREAINILRVINPPRESKRIFDEFMQARDLAISALEKQERSNAQNVNSTHRSRPNALESLKILKSAKDTNAGKNDRWIPVTERLPD